jgi:hypothetical protein
MTFTYVSPQIRKIRNLFRHTKVKIAFKCNNKISQLMKPNIDNNTPCYNRSGIYKLTRNTCKLAYVGQTSQSLKLRFQEHTQYIRNNNPQLAYAQHILHNRHECGPIDHGHLLKPLNDTTMLTPFEQYFIQTLHQEGQLIPEQSPWGEKRNTSPACHWPLLHTTWRNQSSNFLHTVHVVPSCRSPNPCLQQQQQVRTF